MKPSETRLLNEVAKNLTSSKNERLCFSFVSLSTAMVGKTSRIILNDEFYKLGVSTRKALNLALNRLVEKGLIFKVQELLHRNDFDTYRYQVNFKGCSHFLESISEKV